MKALSFSYCFPNQNNPTWGMFVYQRLRALAKIEELKVCSPQPWFPMLKPKSKVLSDDSFAGLSVYRPGFLYTPGVFKDADGRFYGRGLGTWFSKLCETWRPDLLDAHFAWPDGVGVAELAKKTGIPYLVTLRGKLYECLKSPSQTRQCAAALQGAAAVISVSSRLADEARKLGVSDERLHVIPNGVDIQHFRPRDKGECRSMIGLPSQGRILVTVAHLGHRKGHHEVIRALSGLPDDVRLVIVGGAAQGGSIEQLQAIARGAGVEKRLLLVGPQPYDRIPYYFSAADASVLASYREGCPNAVLESLACGTPVVATDVGAIPDILPTPYAGRIVSPMQIEPLMVALNDVLKQSWDAEKIVGDSGVRDWCAVAEDIQAVFKAVVDK